MSHLEKYKALRPKIEAFSLRLKNLLIDIAELHALNIHVVEQRAKSVDSFNHKVSSPGKSYHDPLNEITDLCGLRVIFYYQEDVNKFCSAIYDEFDIDKANSVNKSDELNSDQFGYMSTHIVCALSDKRAELFEWKKFSNIKFEIQVRTVLQHAWASISHAIEYKSKIDTPKPLARQLNRIAGLLELSDEQFSDLKTKSESLKIDISENTYGEYEDINALTVEYYLQNSPSVKKIISVIKASKLEFFESTDMDNLILFSKTIGYKTINEIEDVLSRNTQDLEAAFNHFFDVHTTNTSSEALSGDTDHWCTVALLFQQKISVINKLKKLELWSDDYFQSIIGVIKM